MNKLFPALWLLVWLLPLGCPPPSPPPPAPGAVTVVPPVAVSPPADSSAPCPTASCPAPPASAAVVTASGTQFVELYGEHFELVNTVQRELSEGWPKASYTVLQFKARKTGSTRVSYTFTRNRGTESETITRQFPVHVIGKGKKRTVVVAHPYHVPARVGDLIEIPVPNDDPWGKLEGFKWNAPEPEKLYGPFAPRGNPYPCPNTAKTPSPKLRLRETRCIPILLRSLDKRIEQWGRLEAVRVGHLPTHNLVIVKGPELVLPAYVRHEFEKRPRSTSSMTVVAPSGGVPLMIGDEVWLLLGSRRSPRSRP